MKKLLAILASTLMAVSLIGCGSDTSAGEPAAEPAAEPATQEAAPAAETSGDSDLSTKKVGVCIYQFSDNFMTLFRTELENYLISLGFAKENITIQDGANDQATQTGQIETFIADGVDVLIVNPVNSSSAATITDKVVEAGIPLVYINREPDADEEKRWEDNKWNVTYVGCDARQSGTMQGEIIAELPDHGDLNGDGKISYMMIEGEPENIDAQNTTSTSLPNWPRALAQSCWPCVWSQLPTWSERQLTSSPASSRALTENSVRY